MLRQLPEESSSYLVNLTHSTPMINVIDSKLNDFLFYENILTFQPLI